MSNKAILLTLYESFPVKKLRLVELLFKCMTIALTVTFYTWIGPY